MTCFEVLGIEPTKEKKIIKRAYARVIKLYHPEENPKGFERVHDAYKEALLYADEDIIKIKQSEQLQEILKELPQEVKLTTELLNENVHTISAFISEMKTLFKYPDFWNDLLQWKRIFESPIFQVVKYDLDFLKILSEELTDNCRLEMPVWDFLISILTFSNMDNESFHWYEQEFKYAYSNRKRREWVRQKLIDLFEGYCEWNDKELWVEFLTSLDFQMMRYNMSFFELIKACLRKKRDIHISIWRVILTAYSFDDTEESFYQSMGDILRSLYNEQWKVGNINNEETKQEFALRKIKEYFNDGLKRNDTEQWKALFEDKTIQEIKNKKEYRDIFIKYSKIYFLLSSSVYKCFVEEFESIDKNIEGIFNDLYERAYAREEKEEKMYIVHQKKNRKELIILKSIFAVCTVLFLIWFMWILYQFASS